MKDNDKKPKRKAKKLKEVSYRYKTIRVNYYQSLLDVKNEIVKEIKEKYKLPKSEDPDKYATGIIGYFLQRFNYRSDWKETYAPLPIAAESIKKATGSRYARYLNLLIEKGVLIVTRDKFFEKEKKGYCREFTINPKYLSREMKVVETKLKFPVYRSPKKKLPEELKIIESIKRISWNTNRHLLEDYIEEISSPDYIAENKCTFGVDIPNLKYGLKYLNSVKSRDEWIDYADIYNKSLIKVGKKIYIGTPDKMKEKNFYGFYLDKEIDDGNYYIPSPDFLFSKKALLDRAAKEKKELILYKGKCYIENRRCFLERKSMDIKNSLEKCRLMLIGVIDHKETPFSNRNETNRRLDNLATIIHSIFFKFLLLDGEIIFNIDISNSQFTFLAMMISHFLEAINNGTVSDIEIIGLKEEYKQCFLEALLGVLIKEDGVYRLPQDLQEFVDKAASGEFYESFARKAWDVRYKGSFSQHNSLDSLQKAIEINQASPEEYKAIRGDSKKVMFETCFPKWNSRSDSKKTLNSLFGSLVSLMDNFKKNMIKFHQGNVKILKNDKKSVVDKKMKDASDLGNSELPRMLQSVETGLCIDTVLIEIFDLLMLPISKHDSFLCKESDVDKVHEVFKRNADSFFGKENYRLTIEKIKPFELKKAEINSLP